MSGQMHSQCLIKKANNNERFMNEAVTQTCTGATVEQLNIKMLLSAMFLCIYRYLVFKKWKQANKLMNIPTFITSSIQT